MRISDWSSDVCSSDLFFRIKKADIIGIPDPEYIIAQNANGISGFGDLVERNPDGSVYEVYATRANLLEQKIKGIDVGAEYTFGLGSAGKLNGRGDATYTASSKLTPARPEERRVGKECGVTGRFLG